MPEEVEEEELEEEAEEAECVVTSCVCPAVLEEEQEVAEEEEVLVKISYTESTWNKERSPPTNGIQFSKFHSSIFFSIRPGSVMVGSLSPFNHSLPAKSAYTIK